MSKNIRLPDYEQGIIMAQIDQIRRLEAECDRLREALKIVSDCIPRIIEDEMDRVITPEAIDAVEEALKAGVVVYENNS